MTILGLKTLGEGVEPLNKSPAVSHWVSVDSLQLPHHWNIQGEKGNVKDFYVKSGRVGFGDGFQP